MPATISMSLGTEMKLSNIKSPPEAESYVTDFRVSDFKVILVSKSNMSKVMILLNCVVRNSAKLANSQAIGYLHSIIYLKE